MCPVDCFLWPPPQLSVCLSVCLFADQSVHLSVSQPVSQPVRVPVCLPIRLLNRLSLTSTTHTDLSRIQKQNSPQCSCALPTAPKDSQMYLFWCQKKEKKRGIGLSCANSCPHARCSITSWNNYTEGEGAGQDCRQNIQHANYFLPGWSLSPQQLWHLNHNLTTLVTVLTKRFFHGESLKKRMYLHYVRGVVSFQSQGQSFPVTN